VFLAWIAVLLSSVAQAEEMECSVDSKTYSPLVRQYDPVVLPSSCYSSAADLAGIAQGNSVVADLRPASEKSFVRIPGAIDVPPGGLAGFLLSVPDSVSVVAVTALGGAGAAAGVCELTSQYSRLTLSPFGVRSLIAANIDVLISTDNSAVHSPFDIGERGGKTLNTNGTDMVFISDRFSDQKAGSGNDHDIYRIIPRGKKPLGDIVESASALYVFSVDEYPVSEQDIISLKTVPNVFFTHESIEVFSRNFTGSKKAEYSGKQGGIRGCQ